MSSPCAHGRILGDRNAPCPTVFVIDDDSVVASQISGLLTSQGWQVFAFRTGLDFLKVQRPAGPACIVLEAALPDRSGLDLQRQLADVDAALPMVFIARRPNVRAIVEVMRRGACDFLPKPLSERELLDAVGRALNHDREVRAKRAELAELFHREDRLTARERGVLARIVNGWLNKQVAAELGVAEGTVKVYRHRLMKKMGVTSLTELVRMADRISHGRADAESVNPHRRKLAAIRATTDDSSASGNSPTTNRR